MNVLDVGTKKRREGEATHSARTPVTTTSRDAGRLRRRISAKRCEQVNSVTPSISSGKRKVQKPTARSKSQAKAVKAKAKCKTHPNSKAKKSKKQVSAQ